jgi:tetratricopeptide (TPR) repeat protein
VGEALVKRASVIYIGGNAQRAEPMLQEAVRLLHDERTNASPLVRLYQLQSSIDLSKGNLPEARRSGLKSLELARQTFGEDDEKSIQALATVARIEGADSDYNTARNHFDEAIEKADRVTTMHPRKLIWMKMERAQLNIKAGQFRVAADELSSLADRCEKVLERNAVTCTSIRRAEASIWLDLGFAQKANNLLPTFIARIDNQESPQDQVEALLTACRILLHSGASQEHLQWWDQLKEFGKAVNSTKIPDRYKYSTMLLLASRLLHASQPNEALVILDDLEKRYIKAESPMNQLRSQIYFYRGIAEHQRGHYEIALDLMSRAATTIANKQSADHPRTALQSVLKAKTLWALRRPAEALEVLDHAALILQPAMGADAPKFQSIQMMKNEIGSNKFSPATSVRQPELFY